VSGGARIRKGKKGKSNSQRERAKEKGVKRNEDVEEAKSQSSRSHLSLNTGEEIT